MNQQNFDVLFLLFSSALKTTNEAKRDACKKKKRMLRGRKNEGVLNG